MLKQSDVIVTHKKVHGFYECVALINGHRVSRSYYFHTKRESIRRFVKEMNAEHERKYQPKTGAKCGCRKGEQRDNCPNCEGTGMVIDFRTIRARRDNA